MPGLARVDGVKIRMQNESGGRHHTPHFHAVYNGMRASIALNGEVLEGGLPSKKLKTVLEWTKRNSRELSLCWELLQDGRNPSAVTFAD